MNRISLSAALSLLVMFLAPACFALGQNSNEDRVTRTSTSAIMLPIHKSSDVIKPERDDVVRLELYNYGKDVEIVVQTIDGDSVLSSKPILAKTSKILGGKRTHVIAYIPMKSIQADLDRIHATCPNWCYLHDNANLLIKAVDAEGNRWSAGKRIGSTFSCGVFWRRSRCSGAETISIRFSFNLGN